MRVNGKFLFWGVFLATIGGVLVASDLRIVDTTALGDVLRLWPLAVIAIGVALVLSRTDRRIPALALSAALTGLVLGAAFSVGPRFAEICGTRADVAGQATTQGTFEGPATVAVRGACGSLQVTTAPGNGWQLAAANTAGRAPSVESSASSLSIDAGADNDARFLDAGRDAWDLTLPTSDLDRLSLVVTAGRGRIDLPGAQIDELALTANAAAMAVDASAASVSDLSAVVNVGSLSIHLPAESDLTGTLRVGAGDLRICAPPGLGLRVTSTDATDQVIVGGLHQTGINWQSPEYASATHHADLTVSSTFGAVEIDPIGGCA
jgi:hypothetical protein